VKATVAEKAAGAKGEGNGESQPDWANPQGRKEYPREKENEDLR
jgi:hypothetical protein